MFHILFKVKRVVFSILLLFNYYFVLMIIYNVIFNITISIQFSIMNFFL